MIKFKFVGFIISFLTAILVITNGNGSLFQNAFGDSHSVEDSVDEIVESAEDEDNQAREEAEDLAEEVREDSDDEARDRDSGESEDDEYNEDESENRGEDDSDDATTDFESETENIVREIKDNIGNDVSDDTPSLGEGSGMQIFVSPREIIDKLDQEILPPSETQEDEDTTCIFGTHFNPDTGRCERNTESTRNANEFLDQHLDNIENALGDFIDDSFPDFDDQDHPHGFIDFPRSPNIGGEPCPGVEPCPFATIIDTRTCECVDPLEDVGENNGLQGTNPDGIIEGSLNILFPTGGVSASPGNVPGSIG